MGLEMSTCSFEGLPRVMSSERLRARSSSTLASRLASSAASSWSLSLVKSLMFKNLHIDAGAKGSATVKAIGEFAL